MKKYFDRIGKRFESWDRETSLKRKMMIAIVAVSSAAVSLSVLIVFLIEFQAFKNRVLEDYETTTRMLAQNLEAALAFEDRQDSTEVLEALSERKFVEAGAVYLTDGRVLATYSRESDPASEDLPAFESVTGMASGRILVNESVILDGKPLGVVVVRADTDEVYRFLWVRGAVALVLIGAISFVAVFLAGRIARTVSRPILELAETAQRITQMQDFSTRHPRTRNDETGRLVDAFNEMMAEIEKRNGLVRSNEARFRSYFENGISGAGILDTDLRWIEPNGKLLEMLGCRWSCLDGRCLGDMMEADGANLTAEAIRKSEKGILTKDCWLSIDGGKRVYARMSLRIVAGTPQRSEHVLLLAQDITDRKLNEEEILREKEKAEALSKAKDEFLSVISHELRTPLNPIIGYVEMLQRKRTDDEDAKRLNLIKNSAVHLLGLINDVLDYSRFEQGVVSLKKDWIDYIELCEEVFYLMSQQGAAKGIDMRFTESDSKSKARQRTMILGDRLRLQQILLNFVGNALKFTDEGWIEMRVSVKRDGGNLGRVRIEVEDTGIGIKDGEKSLIFDPFTQADTSLSREHEGLGLGLAVSRKIVLAMQGDIGFESDYGKGSTFWIEFPAEISGKSKVEKVEDEDKRRVVEGRARILLVEDEPINRELARALLSEYGHSVECAADGMEGLEKAEDGRFDLIFMDIMMPRLNGIEAAKRIREESERNRQTPIIAVTAHVTESSDRSYQEAGINDCLSKPYTDAKLNEILAKWLKLSADS